MKGLTITKPLHLIKTVLFLPFVRSFNLNQETLGAKLEFGTIVPHFPVSLLLHIAIHIIFDIIISCRAVLVNFVYSVQGLVSRLL